MQKGIYNLCLQAGLCACTPDPVKTIHGRFPNFVRRFPHVAEQHSTLTAEQRAIFEVALYPEIWMCSEFLNTYRREKEAAQASADEGLAVKARMKYEILRDVVSAWQDVRTELGLWPELRTEVEE